MSSKLIDLEDVNILVETDGAYRIEHLGNSAWVPKSQVEWHEEDEVMTIPEWLAIEKDLI